MLFDEIPDSGHFDCPRVERSSSLRVSADLMAVQATGSKAGRILSFQAEAQAPLTAGTADVAEA